MRLVALVLAVAAAAALPAGAAAAPKAPLDHDGRWFTDRTGRVVVLRGWNMVYKVGSYRPEDTGFGRDDARFLRRQGFNSIRLGIIYRGLEPRPPAADGRPRYEAGYLKSIARTERILRRERIYTLLDFHQDLFHEEFEGEGWPSWQVLGGLPREPKQGFPENYLGMPALNEAFDHFWANDEAEGVPLQDAYARAWKHVARRFRSKPYVMGYDLINEPWPGQYPTFHGCANPGGCPVFDSTTLTGFSTRVIDAIREVDPETLAFYEPLVTFDFGAMTHHADTEDENAGFSFHNYCLPGAFGGPAGASCEELEDLVFQNAETQSEATGDVPFLTEFSATDDAEANARILEIADEHMTSWQSWHYCDCEDPTTQGPGVQSLVPDPADPPRGENLKREKLKLFARPYPRAVAGTPEGWSFDPQTRTFELTYTSDSPDGERLARRRLTEVFLPRLHYRDGYEVVAEGAAVVSRPGARVLKLKRRRGAESVSVTVTPAQ